MRRIIGKTALILFVLAVIYLLVLWSEWLPLSTPAGKKAVAIMGAPLPPIADDDNAFSEIWLFSYDIPDADKAKILAADIEKFSKSDSPLEYASAAEGKYPKFIDNENLLCKPKQENCLEQIRLNLEKYDDLFSKNEKLSSKAIALTRFRTSRSQFSPGLSTPLANFSEPEDWQLTRAAYLHAKGKSAEAVDMTCRAAASWRGFAENSQGLIDQMVGQAYYAGQTQLFAKLLSENPKDTVLPESCVEAYRPVESKKFPLCHSMQLEFQMMRNFSKSMKSGSISSYGEARPATWSNKLSLLWFNQRASNETYALNLASMCSDDNEIRQAANAPKEGVWNGLSVSELAFNPIGGILGTISSGTYSDYENRLQNISLTQQALQAVLVQRKQGNPLVKPEDFLSENKKLRFNTLSNAVEVDLFQSAKETRLLSLPLSGTKIDK
ncbi:MAG: hypothetical protein ABI644_10220 [Arenimonas sp.]